jgi:hypothetical protein
VQLVIDRDDMSFIVIAFFENIDHLEWGMRNLKLLIVRNGDVAATRYGIERRKSVTASRYRFLATNSRGNRLCQF